MNHQVSQRIGEEPERVDASARVEADAPCRQDQAVEHGRAADARFRDDRELEEDAHDRQPDCLRVGDGVI